MVLIEESRNDAEVSNAGAGPQPRAVPKRSLNSVITFAYIFHQAEKRLAPCGTLQSITELAEHLSTHMQLVVPRQQLIEPPAAQMPPPTQMLRFTNNIPAEIFTNRLIHLQIELVNIESGSLCTGEPASPLEVEIFVTRGNFPSNDRKLRKCKPLCPRNKATMSSLVQTTGTTTARRGRSFKSNVVAKLDNGRADVKVKITDNSSWVRSGMFKLVARVVKGSYQGRRIKEALSEAFPVKESKMKGRKADVPSPTDPVSKLINVGKKYEKILHGIKINTVLDFFNELEADPEGLKGKVGMQNTKWENTVEHARQCRVSPEQVNVSNSGGNGTGDSVTSNLGIQQGNMEDTHLIDMGMGQQRDPAACFGSDQMEHLHPISSLNGNNGPSGAFEEMPEQPSTGHGMTVDDDSNCNQDCYDPDISVDDYFSPEIPGLEPCTLPNPMPEFQPRNMGMGEQVAPESNLVSGQMERLPSNTSFNGNNEPSGAFEEMPEQPSTGHGMTMDNDIYCNQGYHISIDDYISPEIPGLEPCTLPNPMPEFQPRNMGMGKQVAPESNLASDQMERVPSNTPFNRNDVPNEILEGMLEHSTIIPNFGRLYSNQWKHDFPNISEFSYGGSSHQFS